MLTITIVTVALAAVCSVLSRSALQWCAYLVAGVIAGRVLGLHNLHTYLFVVDAAIMIMMFGSYSYGSRRWQEPVAVIQCGIFAIYAAYSLFGTSMLWLTIPFIDVANLAFLAQALIVALGGLSNSKRNYLYAKSRKRSGDKTPFLLLAWRVTS